MASHPTHDTTADSVGADHDGAPPRVEYAQHKQTFDAFMGLIRIAIGAVVFILVFMAWYLL